MYIVHAAPCFCFGKPTTFALMDQVHYTCSSTEENCITRVKIDAQGNYIYPLPPTPTTDWLSNYGLASPGIKVLPKVPPELLNYSGVPTYNYFL